MEDTIARVIRIAESCSGRKNLDAISAVDQDMKICGDDISWFALQLSREFGDQVWQWPWQRFAGLNEGLPLLAPLILIWQLITWPIRGSFEYPNMLERLELGHIAKVLDAGLWFEP